MIYSVKYNKRNLPDGTSTHDYHAVGDTRVTSGCESITEHLPRGEGDRLWYDIKLNNGFVKRIFDPFEVMIIPDSQTPA